MNYQNRSVSASKLRAMPFVVLGLKNNSLFPELDRSALSAAVCSLGRQSFSAILMQV
jgi:hypothetical protein